MKIKNLPLYLIVFLLIFGSFSIFKVFAASENSVLVDIIPPNPNPNENTKIILNSYANNLDTVLITWSINGKNILSGIGKKIFLTNAPNAGEETTITVNIEFPDGDVEKRIILRPIAITLLWQANDSYTPPFYKGKAMAMSDSEIKVVAIPEIKNKNILINPKNLTYDWKINYENEQDRSGYGKNYFLYFDDYLEKSTTVGVVASNVDQKFSTEKHININTNNNSEILFYKNDKKLGTLWESALPDTHTINGPEIIQAVPYFMSPKDIRIPTLRWNWFINNNPINILNIRPNFIPITTEQGTSGKAKLKLKIENENRIFQETFKEINIEF